MTRANEMNVESHMEFDSHANMPVVGKHAYIIAETGKKVDVSPFTPDYKPLTVPLVDAMVKYDNPNNGKSYILVLHNALYVPLMDNNLVPPFMLREMGVTVNDIPKIHKEDPSVDDHTMTFVEMGFRIPLSLWGIFLYFPTSKPTHDDLLNPNEVYILSPATWNPHSDAYSTNEESMLDWEGNMQPKKDHQHRIVLDDVEDDVNMVASLLITPLEQEAIDTHLVEDDKQYDKMETSFIPRPADNTSCTLGSISNTLVDLDLSGYICEKERDGRIAASIGSTNTLASHYISDSEPEDDEPNHDDSTCNDDDDSFDLSFDLDSKGAQEKVAEFFSHATNASNHMESLLNTYPRYGASHKKTPEELLILQLKHLYEHKILLCHAIMALMIACSDIDVYRITSSWIHSLPPRKGDIPPVGTHAANSSSQAKDSYMSCQGDGNWKSFKQSNSLPRKLGHPPQSLQICPVNKCHMTFENSVTTLEQPYGH